MAGSHGTRTGVTGEEEHYECNSQFYRDDRRRRIK